MTAAEAAGVAPDHSNMSDQRVIIVGGGVAGLAAAMKLAELGANVDLFALGPVRRSVSVCAQAGINGAVNLKGEGDSPRLHFEDTIRGGDNLAHQPPVKGMTDAAPGIIHMLDRMGVAFNRTGEGIVDFRRSGGSPLHRTAFAGATTGQQILHALDEQVRRHEATGRVNKFEFWEFLSAVLDDHGICRGIVAMNLRSLELKAFRADAVVMATGGCGAIFGRSTMGTQSTGSAAGALYQQGARYANGEFIQFHPTAVPGTDKLRLMSEAARAEGGRLWVPRDKNETRAPDTIPENERLYFLEEQRPADGNLAPPDVAARAIFEIVHTQGHRVEGHPCVYLDVRHLDTQILKTRLRGILETYAKFTGEDPSTRPMKVFPAVHYSMGGLWVDAHQQTNLPGLFAIGECEYQYHGASRLGGNSLLSCIHGGLVAAPAIVSHLEHMDRTAAEVASSVFEGAVAREQSRNDGLLKAEGSENPYGLHAEMGEVMTANVGVVRHNDRLREADAKLQELMERYQRIGISQRNTWANQVIPFARQLWNMMELARVITVGALRRDESRGAHYKPEFPFLEPPAVKASQSDEERRRSPEYLAFHAKWKSQNERWLKSTIAEFDKQKGPILSYERVDTTLMEPGVHEPLGQAAGC